MARVLLVEDDAALRDVIAFNLDRAGHEAMVAADGAAGLRLAREEQPDLIVLDLMLPRVPGLDVLRAVRREAATPVLILSARGEEEDRVRGLREGADDFLGKPFTLRELLARIDAVLRRAQGGAAPGVYRAGDLEVDLGAREVRRGGAAVALTPREFGLLEHFVRHPNQAFSRERLLDAVWGEDYEGDARTVDVHVYWLRRKLEADPARPVHFVTVRQYGYRFVPAPAPERAPSPALG